MKDPLIKGKDPRPRTKADHGVGGAHKLLSHAYGGGPYRVERKLGKGP